MTCVIGYNINDEFIEIISKEVHSREEAFDIGNNYLDNNIVLFIDNAPLINKEEESMTIYNSEEYRFIDNKFILVHRFLKIKNKLYEDELERYEEDYLPGAGSKFNLGEKVKLSKIKYPDAPQELIVSAIPEKNKNKYWQNLYALEYTKDDGEIEYYEYDMINEKFIEKLNLEE